MHCYIAAIALPHPPKIFSAQNAVAAGGALGSLALAALQERGSWIWTLGPQYILWG